MNTPKNHRGLRLSDLAYAEPQTFPSGPPSDPIFMPSQDKASAFVDAQHCLHVIEPSARWPGFFFVSKVVKDSSSVEFTKRPIPADWVEMQLKVNGMDRPDRTEWRQIDSAGVLVPMESFPGVEQ